MRVNVVALVAAPVAIALTAGNAWSQWTNRYPRNAGFNHQVYLEGYELPTLASGALDAAVSREGEVVVASRGWLWRLDEGTGVATRITTGSGVDSRPAWSPDGRHIAFVRDDSRTLAVVLRDVASGREVEVDRGMALDPAFSADGRKIVYANATAGDLDLWEYDVASGNRTRLTNDAGLELRPQPHPDGARLIYLSKTRSGGDQLRMRLAGGSEQVLLQGNIVSQARPALSPDGRLIVYNWPGPNGWELRLLSVDRPGATVLLEARPRGRPLTPAWSADGAWIYFSEGDDRQVARLYRVAAGGGVREEVAVRAWDWQEATGRLVIRTTCAACPMGGAARLSVVDASGHPAIPAEGMARFDGQNGVVYFYSPGVIEVELPAGEATVRGVQGLATPERVERVTVAAGERRTVTLDLAPLWDARGAGWYSGDHHFHLNYGGIFDLAPNDLLPLLRGEGMDVATPMLANLHNRYEDQALFPGTSSGAPPIVSWAQEVRSHFLGHVGLIGTTRLFWPWVWGPGYEVYGRDDRLNRTALDFARAQGGAGIYVHPVSHPSPFSEAGMAAIPVALVADAATGAIDLLEIVCLWNSSVGTTELWYRLLNAGLVVAPSGGTDVMTDFHRTMAVGTTRVYVRPEGAFHFGSYLAALRAGRSFVTNGPMLDFVVDGDKRPGDVLAPSLRRARFTVRAASAIAVDSVALIVNGRTVRSFGGVAPGGTVTHEGTIDLPPGGWVAVRAIGPQITQWPAMADYAFAHTAPVWIGSRGSTEPGARRLAANDLMRALAVAEQRLVAGYDGSDIPGLRAHFAEARTKLEGLLR